MRQGAKNNIFNVHAWTVFGRAVMDLNPGTPTPWMLDGSEHKYYLYRANLVIST